MSTETQGQLGRLQKRSISLSSQLTTDSTVSDFIAYKARIVASNVEYCATYKRGLHDMVEANQLTPEELRAELVLVQRNETPIQAEASALKRQKRAIEADMEEVKDHRPNQDEAYASLLSSYVMKSSCHQRRSKFDQSAFKAAVIKYYDGADISKWREDDGVPVRDEYNMKVKNLDRRLWCPLTGWHPEERVKAAHLVPKSLQGPELSNLFGVGEAILSEPRNGEFSSPPVQLIERV